MKKTLTAAVATLGMVAAGAAVAGGPGPMAPPAPAPMVEWYIGAGITMNSVSDISIGVPNARFSWGVGWNGFVGADIGDHWGLEANYTYVGKVKFAGVVAAKQQLGYLSALYRQMLFGPLYFVGKLGYGFGEVSLTGSAAAAGLPGVAAFNRINGFGLVYGAGLGARFGAFGLRTMYTRMSINNLLDISSVDLSAMWYFGS